MLFFQKITTISFIVSLYINCRYSAPWFLQFDWELCGFNKKSYVIRSFKWIFWVSWPWRGYVWKRLLHGTGGVGGKWGKSQVRARQQLVHSSNIQQSSLCLVWQICPMEKPIIHSLQLQLEAGRWFQVVAKNSKLSLVRTAQPASVMELCLPHGLKCA